MTARITLARFFAEVRTNSPIVDSLYWTLGGADVYQDVADASRFSRRAQIFSSKASVFHHIWIAIHICEHRNCSKPQKLLRSKNCCSRARHFPRFDYGCDVTPARLVSGLTT